MATPLSTSADTYPWWTSTALNLPASQVLDYKFIVQSEDRSGNPTWEEGSLTGNRSAVLVADMELAIRTSWGLTTTQTTTAPLQTHKSGKGLGQRTLSESNLARQSEERTLVFMAESSAGTAAAEAPQAQPLAASLAARDERRRNFSQSLLAALDDHLPEEANAQTADSEGISSPSSPMRRQALRGVSLKHINSFSALSSLADSEEKNAAREGVSRANPNYRPHNLGVPVVIVTSEFAPWSKTGGLGLVAASYSYEFPRSGHRTMVVSPMYKKYDGLKLIGETQVQVNGSKETVKYHHLFQEVCDGRGCDCIFVEHSSILKENGGLYNDDDGKEYPDNLLRFTLLSLAALEAPLVLKFEGGSTYGDKVVFLANDWQAGLVPLYLCYKFRPNRTYAQARCLYVVHNLGYQGQYHGYNPNHFFGVCNEAAGDLAQGNCVNLSKAALICADRVIAVSPNYSKEIQTPSGGFGLQDFVRAKAHALRLHGILNGIDDCWNPSKDKHIFCNYSEKDFFPGKAANKKMLQQNMCLNEDPHCVLIGFVGRLTWQKGVDVIGSVIPWLMQDTGNGVTGNVQLIMMGNGEKQYAETLQQAQENYRGRVCGFVGFDPQVEHQIMAGCDLFLMPSRYEPCGLPQMYSQQYGTLPIVTATGGLKDTVKDVSQGPHLATGFHVTELNPNKLKEVLYRAAEVVLRRPTEFQSMQRTAMLTNFYWPQAIDEYERHIDFTMNDPPTVRRA
jgi:starch synthase